MRRLIVAVLGVFTLNMFLPGVACGDFFSVEQTNQSCCDLREGPRFGMDDMPGPIFLSSNPNAWPVFTGGPAASLYVSAGTLVSSTADTSIYAPGSLTFFGDLSIVGIPNGTACADFGWLPYAYSGSCRIDIGLTGSTGEVVATLGDIVGTGTEQVIRNLSVVTPVSFDITPDLAFALGISTGPYIGVFELLGKDVENERNGSHFLNEIDRIGVSGVAVPEPTSIILLGTAAIGVGFALKRKTNV